MTETKRDANVDESARLRPAQSDERLTDGLVSIDCHCDEHIRRVVDRDELEVGHGPTRQIAGVEQVVVHAPQQHGQYVAQTHIHVRYAQIQDEEVHAREFDWSK